MSTSDTHHVKIFITGGHITPAMAVIEEIRSRYPSWQIVFIGRKIAQEGSIVLSEEYRIIQEQGIPFISITTGRLQRILTIHTIPSLLKVPFGFFQALYYLAKVRPHAIISFGGYVALPVVISGWLLGTPTLTHEQTNSPGLTNRLIGLIAKKICVTYKETAQYFPLTKTVVTGLPLRSELFQKIATPQVFTHIHDPILYITGGSTGATSLNSIIYPIVGRLVKKFIVIHQVGRSSLNIAQNIRDALSPKEKTRYIITPYLDSNDHAWVMQHATLVLSRAGANTVGELSALGKIAILVPLPWSGGGEQEKNAHYLATHGGAKVVDQQSLTPEGIIRMTHQILQDPSYSKKANDFKTQIRTDGAKKVVHELVSLLGYA